MQTLWPILVVVAANTLYNICAKQTPADIDPFFSLAITYGVAMVLCILLYGFTAASKQPLQEFSKVNWAAYALGAGIVGLEFGYLNVYRVGWKMNTASLVANICLAVILVLVGFFAYKESVSLRQMAGMAVCIAGLILVSRP